MTLDQYTMQHIAAVNDRFYEAMRVTTEEHRQDRCRRCGIRFGPKAQISKERGLCGHCHYGTERP